MGIAQSGSSLGGIVWSQVLVFGTEYFDDWRIVIRLLSAAVCIIWYPTFKIKQYLQKFLLLVSLV